MLRILTTYLHNIEPLCYRDIVMTMLSIGNRQPILLTFDNAHYLKSPLSQSATRSKFGISLYIYTS